MSIADGVRCVSACRGVGDTSSSAANHRHAPVPLAIDSSCVGALQLLELT